MDQSNCPGRTLTEVDKYRHKQHQEHLHRRGHHKRLLVMFQEHWRLSMEDMGTGG